MPGESFYIIRSNEIACLSGIDDLTGCACGCPDRWQAKAHPFEIDNAKPFITGRHHQHMGLFEPVDE